MTKEIHANSDFYSWFTFNDGRNVKVLINNLLLDP